MNDKKSTREFDCKLRDHEGRVIVTVTTNDGDVVVSTPGLSGRAVMDPDTAGMLALIIGEAGVWADKICRKGWQKELEALRVMHDQSRLRRKPGEDVNSL